MAGRGSNHFLLNDVRRAIRSAREAGIEISKLDIIMGQEGSTTLRLHVASQELAQPPDASDWNEATEQLKRKSKRR